ncbi:MAG: hypothetical protein KGL39_22445 [Patescibacteria group bacterium]|nr:hypothetical protein [Patescibacteria group bacterium]
MSFGDDEDFDALTAAAHFQYKGDYRHAAAIHDEMAWRAEQFFEEIEKYILVTGSPDPCLYVPQRAVHAMPQWDIMIVHKCASALWAAINTWDYWQTTNANGPPEFLETQYPGDKIAHIFRLLIQRWGWLSIISRDPRQPDEVYEPPAEITGLETIALSELQSLSHACDEFRSIIGYNHDPRFRVYPGKDESTAPDREPSATRGDLPVARALTGPIPPLSETIARQSERSEAAVGRTDGHQSTGDRPTDASTAAKPARRGNPTRHKRGEAALKIRAVLETLAADGKWDVEEREIIRLARVARSTYYHVLNNDRTVQRVRELYEKQRLGRGPDRIDDF